MLKYLYESQYYTVFTELRGFLEYIELNLILDTQNPQKLFDEIKNSFDS